MTLIYRAADSYHLLPTGLQYAFALAVLLAVAVSVVTLLEHVQIQRQQADWDVYLAEQRAHIAAEQQMARRTRDLQRMAQTWRRDV